jgi:hypothetical protein
MRTSKNDANALKKLLLKKKTATMPELKAVLETDVNMTVFRKLNELSYITSYSHSGRYYTLSAIPEFDEQGIWKHDSVMFSNHGNLQKTVKAFVDKSETGYSASELQTALQIEVKEPLLILFRKEQVERKKISGRYIYFTTDLQSKKNQQLNRTNQKSDFTLDVDYYTGHSVPDKVKKSIWLFFSILNEKQRRLFVGLESLKIGHGGDKKVSKMFGMAPHTVAKGRSELLSESINIERIRKKGAGRIPTEKKVQKS